jgi:hypothetical protein
MNLKPENSRASGQGPEAISTPIGGRTLLGSEVGLEAPIRKTGRRLKNGPRRNFTFEKGTDMRQLFRYNEPTRMDYVVHLSLGLAAVVAVFCSLQATFDFCARLDQIAEWFQAPATVVSAPGEGKKNSFTNATGVEVPALEAGRSAQTNFPAATAEQGMGSPASG